MQKFIITTLLWIAAFTLCSCQEDFVDPDAPTPTNQMVQVEIPITTSSMEVLTRTDENVIKDVNVYFFHSTIAAFFRHTYGSATTVATDLTPGTYKVLVITNMHRDLGNKSYLDLSQIELSAQDTYNDLVMTYTGEITINSSASQITLPPLTVKRNVARINYRVGVTSQAAGIEIKSLQVENVPLRMAAFSDTAFPDASNYSSADFINNTPTEEMLQGTFYMLPNMQGVVPSITSQDKKNKSNAPANATYLLIHALHGNKVLVYRIYLGVNNTSDFNVQSNTAHTMVVNITGDKTTDTRVYSYTVSVKDNIETLYSSPYCTWSNKYNQLSITMEGANLDTPLSAQIQVVRGAGSKFHFNNQIGQPSYKLQLTPGTTNYKLGYYTDATTAPMFTPANKDLVYQVVVSDAYGFSQTYSVTHTYANWINVIYHRDRGSVTADKALYTCQIPPYTAPNGQRYPSPGTAVFYDETGYSIRATPAAGYIFTDWRDSYTYDIISTSPTYTYRASTPSPDLRTDFIVPLSLACRENNKNSTFKINRNQITLTDNNNMTSADVRITCNSADGFFIRNAERNPATEVYEGATVTSYTERVNFSGGQARPAEVSFFPIREGSYSYKIEIMNPSTGSVVNTKLVTQEIVKSTISIDVRINHPFRDRAIVTVPDLGTGKPITAEMWCDPCRLEVSARFAQGDALDYIPAGLTVGYDAQIQYCTSADADQCWSRDGLTIKTVYRYGNVPVRKKNADEAIIFPLAQIDPEYKYLKCAMPKTLLVGGEGGDRKTSDLMMNTQGTLSNLRCTHPQLTITFGRIDSPWCSPF